ncbi:putative serine hydrolase [Pseudolycoriella hygida]|uniref:Serine hydrolase n=1 Tax=Pseudolycoriella hygida TaxID=35572 RepID=A0A9Q0N2I1_9DIPT|nr:putative serine hydrolase [Pseudolycoriella hygida]
MEMHFGLEFNVIVGNFGECKSLIHKEAGRNAIIVYYLTDNFVSKSKFNSLLSRLKRQKNYKLGKYYQISDFILLISNILHKVAKLLESLVLNVQLKTMILQLSCTTLLYATVTHYIDEFELQVPWGHIACKWWGPKNIQPIICMHGWQDNAGTFDPLITQLPSHLKRDYTRIVENMRSNPKFELHRVDGGHHVHLDDPITVGAVITKFIYKYHKPTSHNKL